MREAPEGATFDSLDDLRAKIDQRDHRDDKPGRAVSFRAIISPHPNDYIIYELKPDLDVVFQGVPVRTNSYGMRGPERAPAKRPGVFRIALLGDSYAFGWGVEEEQTFAVQLERLLSNERAAPVEVLNFGVPGYSTFQQVTQFLDERRDFEVDLVLVFFVDNDFGLPFFIRNLQNPEDLADVATFRSMRAQQVDSDARAKTSRFLQTIEPNRHLETLAREMAKRGVPVFVTINPRRGVAVDERNLPVLRKTANLTYLPLREGLLRIVSERGIDTRDLVLPTDPHPSPLRHGIFAELLASKLRDHVRSAGADDNAAARLHPAGADAPADADARL